MMKKEKSKDLAELDCFSAMVEGANLEDADCLEITSKDDVCLVFKSEMTALELASVIDTLSNLASDLTVMLAQACGFCDHCGETHTAEDCEGQQCSDACAMLNGCKETPAEGVMHCALCQGLIDGSGDIRVPEYILEEAGIPTDVKLEAYADEDSGVVTVVKADLQQNITDVPPAIVAILAKSGVCLAELDELIMLEEIVYGK